MNGTRDTAEYSKSYVKSFQLFWSMLSPSQKYMLLDAGYVDVCDKSGTEWRLYHNGWLYTYRKNLKAWTGHCLEIEITQQRRQSLYIGQTIMPCWDIILTKKLFIECSYRHSILSLANRILIYENCLSLLRSEWEIFHRHSIVNRFGIDVDSLRRPNQ